MRQAKLLLPLSIALAPVLCFGCTKTKDSSELDKAKVKQTGSFFTSEQLTKFAGLADLIKNENIPDQTIICTVGDDAINVGDYKLNFRYKQDQAKQLLQASPQAQVAILKEAKQMGVSLTEREKKDLIDASIKKGGAQLQKQIETSQIKKEEFEKQVLDMGLVLKAINSRIEEQLLTEIINNSLLIDAARKNGLGKAAFNKYVDVKHSERYKKYLELTMLTPNQLKDQIIEEILVELMKQEIIKKADISDKDVYEFYKANKENFKHSGRYKWSQILVADPEKDFRAMTSIETEVDQKYPELNATQKQEKVKEIRAQRKEKALSLVRQAKTGTNFSALANNNTDDIPARASKTGGSMGYADLNQLANNQIFKNIASALETMSVNEIYPKPIKSLVGWHIVKLDEKQESGYIAFDEVKEEIKHSLANQNKEMAIRSWIIKQRETVPVKISKRFESFLKKANDLPTNKVESQPETGK